MRKGRFSGKSAAVSNNDGGLHLPWVGPTVALIGSSVGDRSAYLSRNLKLIRWLYTCVDAWL